MTRLTFTREPGYVLRWDVWEVHPTGGKSYSGDLSFYTDVGWMFISSDDSIQWKLGTNVKRAMRTLRMRYRPIDTSDICGCVRYGSVQGPSIV